MAINNYTFQRGVREKEINFKVLCANQNVTLNGLKLSKGDFKIDQKKSFNWLIIIYSIPNAISHHKKYVNIL